MWIPLKAEWWVRGGMKRLLLNLRARAKEESQSIDMWTSSSLSKPSYATPLEAPGQGWQSCAFKELSFRRAWKFAPSLNCQSRNIAVLVSDVLEGWRMFILFSCEKESNSTWGRRRQALRLLETNLNRNPPLKYWNAFSRVEALRIGEPETSWRNRRTERRLIYIGYKNHDLT